MTRLNVVLLLALLASAFYLVRMSYDARRLFSQLDRAQAEARLLDSDHERLLAERQAQATPLRVERAAREKLGMRTATPAVTHYLDAAAPSASSVTAVDSAPSSSASKDRP
jgi:cell division protein FtsL